MITMITGTPGAGKTLYTVEKLLIPLVGTSITYTDASGQEVTAPRTIYTNINGLLLDHEKIDGGDVEGLRDWHKWAKPGAVIVFDEVQRFWQPRANGSKVPDDIQALETHRHMGVDFVLVTQNVMLVDRNIHALAGRHLHVRRIASTHMAIVYEWDHVSRGLLYAKSMNKTPWRYNKKTFDLYKSAEAHTKQKRAIPGLVWFIVVALVALGVLGPMAYSRMNERINGAQPSQDDPGKATEKTSASAIGALKSATVPASATPAPSVAAAPDERVDFIPRLSDRPWTAPAYDHLRTVVQMPVIAGGVCMGEKCACVTGDGVRLEVSDKACAEWIAARPFNPYVPASVTPPAIGLGGTASAGTPSAPGQTAQQPVANVVELPALSGVGNPRADSLQPSTLPPGSPAHTKPPTDELPPISPPSLLSPYRRR